jgi:hypothetical protein
MKSWFNESQRKNALSYIRKRNRRKIKNHSFYVNNWLRELWLHPTIALDENVKENVAKSISAAEKQLFNDHLGYVYFHI